MIRRTYRVHCRLCGAESSIDSLVPDASTPTSFERVTCTAARHGDFPGAPVNQVNLIDITERPADVMQEAGYSWDALGGPPKKKSDEQLEREREFDRKLKEAQAELDKPVLPKEDREQLDRSKTRYLDAVYGRGGQQ